MLYGKRKYSLSWAGLIALVLLGLVVIWKSTVEVNIVDVAFAISIVLAPYFGANVAAKFSPQNREVTSEASTK